MNFFKKQKRILVATVMPRIAPKPMVISYPKCGRTWIANVLLNYISSYKNIETPPLDFTIKPHFKHIIKNTPFNSIVFSHDVFSLKIPIKQWPRYSNARFQSKQKVLLLRDPRDLLVSLYHHSIARVQKNGLDANTSIQEFLKEYDLGIAGLIMFLNIWAPAVFSKGTKILPFYYEDFLGSWKENNKTWIKFVEHITNQPVNCLALEKSVEQHEIKNLKQRLARQENINDDIVGEKGRVRKGKSHGYLDELTAHEIAKIEKRMLSELNPKARKLLSRYF